MTWPLGNFQWRLPKCQAHYKVVRGAADGLAPKCDGRHHLGQGELGGRKPANGLCLNFLLKGNRERHRYQMPAD
jgi:hypothetical protein